MARFSWEAIFCAEPPPDTATGLTTKLDASQKHKDNNATLKDDFSTAVTILSARNAPLDAFRTGVFTLCQLYIIGAIDKPEVIPMLKNLIATFEKTQNAVPAIVKNMTKSGSSADGTTGPSK